LGPDGTMIPHIKISRLPIPLGLSATVVCNLYCLDREIPWNLPTSFSGP
jgi:hypothetical protein